MANSADQQWADRWIRRAIRNELQRDPEFFEIGDNDHEAARRIRNWFKSHNRDTDEGFALVDAIRDEIERQSQSVIDLTSTVTGISVGTHTRTSLPPDAGNERRTTLETSIAERGQDSSISPIEVSGGLASSIQASVSNVSQPHSVTASETTRSTVVLDAQNTSNINMLIQAACRHLSKSVRDELGTSQWRLGPVSLQTIALNFANAVRTHIGNQDIKAIDEYKELETSYRELEQTTITLQAQNKDLLGQVEALNDLNTDLQDLNGNLQIENADSEARTADLRDRNADLLNQTANLQNENNIIRTRNTNLQAQNDDRDRTLQEILDERDPSQQEFRQTTEIRRQYRIQNLNKARNAQPRSSSSNTRSARLKREAQVCNDRASSFGARYWTCNAASGQQRADRAARLAARNTRRV